jgi:hypothetical protein
MGKMHSTYDTYEESLNTESAPQLRVFYIRIQAGEHPDFLQAFQANIYNLETCHILALLFLFQITATE